MNQNENNNPVEFSRLGETYSVVLPCDPPQFGEFIAGLLGRPQSINGRVLGAFEINRQDIENTYYLIQQRVASQNEGSCISFSLTISNSENSSVTLNSYDDFKLYNDIKPVFITGITMSWIYLIKFNYSTIPEKQQIDIVFAIGRYDDDEYMDLYDLRLIRAVPIPRVFRPIGMSYSILHTNRSWGSDIENLISGHLKHYLNPLKGIRKIASDYSGTIGVVTGSIIATMTLGVILYAADIFEKSLVLKAKQISIKKITSIDKISEQVTFITELLANQAFQKQNGLSLIGVIIGLILSIVSGILVSNNSSYTNRSFILINKTSENRKREYYSAKKHSPLRFILSFLGALFIGVAGNYAYYLVSKALNIQ